ncbi:hypothetical protein [Carbonactinospora thermoautotrophica]|uniref:hypothetical protein n=2 Tax=Carbonactinospora thermoautotrophica TaxID=1469144 RepID=UPI00082C7798|nr:hypothetical protein [Carbonactinospora thermoautotrophica]
MIPAPRRPREVPEADPSAPPGPDRMPPPGVSAPRAPVTAPGHPSSRYRGGWSRPPVAWLLAAVLALVSLPVAAGATAITAYATRPEQDRYGGDIPVVRDAGAPVVLAEDEIRALLRKHSRALRERDEKAFLDLYDPKNTKLVDDQRRLYRNLLKVPFREARYEIIRRLGRSVDTFGRGVRVTVDVAFVHQIEGVDIRPVTEWYRWTVVKAAPNAKPVVTAVDGSPKGFGGSKYVYYPAPWDVYPRMHVVRTGHALLLASDRTLAKTERLAPVAERAALDNLAAWRRHGPKGEVLPGFLVVLENDRELFFRLFRSAQDTDSDEAGVSIPMATFGHEDRVRFGGSRIVVDLASGFFQAPRGALEIFRHEMAHSLIQPLDAADSPARPRFWVVEGFAEYLALRGTDPARGAHSAALREYLRRGRFTGRLPTDRDMYHEDLLIAAASYQLGYWAIRFIAEEHGEDKAFAFVARHYQDPAALDAAIRETTGLSRAQFEARWARYVRAQVG